MAVSLYANHSMRSLISLLLCAIPAMASEQTFMTSDVFWRATLDSTWDVLGPFPIHAREQYFLSPSFPLNISQSIDYDRKWPSAYADCGAVNWSKATGTLNGDIDVSFPGIRWKSLRATEGWAALQHHALLRTTVTVYPPTSILRNDVPQLLVNLIQGSYFALIPKSPTSDFIPRWYPGNIYDIGSALPHVVPLPKLPLTDQPTEYDLFISGDYEIRLFGDPLIQGEDIPIQTLSVRVKIQEVTANIVHQQSQDVSSDFFNGYAFGNIIGIGLQSIQGWWTVENVKLITRTNGLHIRLQSTQTLIAPSQTRVIAILIDQTAPFVGDAIELELHLRSGDLMEKILASVPVKHHRLTSSNREGVKGTFLFAGSSPSTFVAIPPAADNLHRGPPILALHGAGVDIIDQDFWVKSLPDVTSCWIISPTGRTSWGLDWHGPSTQDAWLALNAVSNIVRHRIPKLPDSWVFPENSKVILIGHSNGGQGVWYMASRYPDRIIAAIPAAAYMKSQAYIPLTLARGGHFIDPALRAILESSLTPDDNDLYVTNLVNIPILAIHGGDDENVPVWHTRELVNTLKTWNPSANVTLIEDAGGGHWYPLILKRPEVERFIDHMLFAPEEIKFAPGDEFTLTSAGVHECGSLNGWKIARINIPGRLARLHVHQINEYKFVVEPTNVHAFSISSTITPYEIVIDGQHLPVRRFQGEIHISRTESRKWKIMEGDSLPGTQPPGRIQNLLSTSGPFSIIVSDSAEHELLAAQRVAHVLHLYHKIDSHIIRETEANVQLNDRALLTGNMLFIGPPSSTLAQQILSQNKTPVRIINDTVHIGQQRFSREDQAVLFSHPHPKSDSGAFMLFYLYNSDLALEAALRLFPFRTGVTIPDWLVTGEKMANLGAGGIEAAGVWGIEWSLGDAMTWTRG